MISLNSVVLGRPLSFSSGKQGLIKNHCLSVKSLGYLALFINSISAFIFGRNYMLISLRLEPKIKAFEVGWYFSDGL